MSHTLYNWFYRHCTIKHDIVEGGSRLAGGSLNCFPFVGQFRVMTWGSGFWSVALLSLSRSTQAAASQDKRCASVAMVQLTTSNTHSGVLTNSTCSCSLVVVLMKIKQKQKPRCLSSATCYLLQLWHSGAALFRICFRFKWHFGCSSLFIKLQFKTSVLCLDVDLSVLYLYLFLTSQYSPAAVVMLPLRWPATAE